jgi:Caudovirales tail fibre assembly protein.
MTDPNRWAIINTATNIVENVIAWDGVTDMGELPEGYIKMHHDFVNIGWILENGELKMPPPKPPTAEEMLQSQTVKLQSLMAFTRVQKTALSNRVETLEGAVELDMATVGEVEELAIKKLALIEWKRYDVYLGRVTAQSGWYENPVWPAQPEIPTVT